MSLSYIRGDLSQSNDGCYLLFRNSSDLVFIMCYTPDLNVFLSPYIGSGVSDIPYPPLRFQNFFNYNIFTALIGTDGVYLQTDGNMVLYLPDSSEVISSPVNLPECTQTTFTNSLLFPVTGIWYTPLGTIQVQQISNYSGTPTYNVPGDSIKIYDSPGDGFVPVLDTAFMSDFELSFLPAVVQHPNVSQSPVQYTSVLGISSLLNYFRNYGQLSTRSATNPKYVLDTDGVICYSNASDAVGALAFDYCSNNTYCGICYSTPFIGGVMCQSNPSLADGYVTNDTPTVVPFFPSGMTGPNGTDGPNGPEGPEGPPGPQGSTGQGVNWYSPFFLFLGAIIIITFAIVLYTYLNFNNVVDYKGYVRQSLTSRL